MNGQLEFDAVDMHEVDVLEGMVIRPGDVLVLASTEALTLTQTMAIRETAKRQMPELGDVFVLASPLRLVGVYRPNESETP